MNPNNSMRKIWLCLLAIICGAGFVTLDMWFLGKMHFCQLEASESNNAIKKEEIKVRYRRWVFGFAVINICAATGVIATLKRRKALKSWMAACVMLLWATCGSAKEFAHILSTKWDIRLTSAKVEMIRIPTLPIEEYPRLAKFKRVKDVSFYWSGADDKKLHALANVGFTNLQQISLSDCPAVTDEGLKMLTKIPTLKGLGLEGTAITDAGAEMIATQMKLTGVNIANCTNVTKRGILAIARSSSIRSLTFSGENWSEDELIKLIQSFRNIERCGIVDLHKRLNAGRLSAIGQAKGITIVVHPEGALQTGRNYRAKHGL